MRRRLIYSTAVLACAGVVALLADGQTGASGIVPVDSTHRMPSGTEVDPVLEWNQILTRISDLAVVLLSIRSVVTP